MCGIAGVVGSFASSEAPLVKAMLAVLTHRGPDDSGIGHDRDVVLGHGRLRIIGLSVSGRQPMGNLDGRYTITFNGEVYNYLELRKELIDLGHAFRTKTDTEVLLAAYVEWGSKCVSRLNGMWAFAIW